MTRADTSIDLIGWNMSDASGALDYQKLDYEFIGEGSHVVAQIPAAYAL